MNNLHELTQKYSKHNSFIYSIKICFILIPKLKKNHKKKYNLKKNFKMDLIIWFCIFVFFLIGLKLLAFAFQKIYEVEKKRISMIFF